MIKEKIKYSKLHVAVMQVAPRMSDNVGSATDDPHPKWKKERIVVKTLTYTQPVQSSSLTLEWLQPG